MTDHEQSPRASRPQNRSAAVAQTLLLALAGVVVVGLVAMAFWPNAPGGRTAVAAIKDADVNRVGDGAAGSVDRRPPPSPPRAAPPSPQRAATPVRSQFHRRKHFTDCILEAADMADAIGIAPTVSQSSSGNVVSARFEFHDGAVIITCRRAEGVMTVERR